MMMMVTMFMKVAIFHVDSEEKSVLEISTIVTVCIVDIIITDKIKLQEYLRIIGDDMGIKQEKWVKILGCSGNNNT